MIGLFEICQICIACKSRNMLLTANYNAKCLTEYLSDGYLPFQMDMILFDSNNFYKLISHTLGEQYIIKLRIIMRRTLQQNNHTSL